MPWCVANHDIELGAPAAIRRYITSSADHAIAMDQPRFAQLRIASDRKTIRKAHLRGIHIAVSKARKWHAGAERAVELGWQVSFSALNFASQFWLVGIWVAPLSDIV